jgi:hypothetical protein
MAFRNFGGWTEAWLKNTPAVRPPDEARASRSRPGGRTSGCWALTTSTVWSMCWARVRAAWERSADGLSTTMISAWRRRAAQYSTPGRTCTFWRPRRASRLKRVTQKRGPPTLWAVRYLASGHTPPPGLGAGGWTVKKAEPSGEAGRSTTQLAVAFGIGWRWPGIAAR